MTPEKWTEQQAVKASTQTDLQKIKQEPSQSERTEDRLTEPLRTTHGWGYTHLSRLHHPLVRGLVRRTKQSMGHRHRAKPDAASPLPLTDCRKSPCAPWVDAEQATRCAGGRHRPGTPRRCTACTAWEGELTEQGNKQESAPRGDRLGTLRDRRFVGCHPARRKLCAMEPLLPAPRQPACRRHPVKPAPARCPRCWPVRRSPRARSRRGSCAPSRRRCSRLRAARWSGRLRSA